MIFSKLARPSSIQAARLLNTTSPSKLFLNGTAAPLLFKCTQLRKLQSELLPGKSIPVLDLVSGVYEDPNYSLEVKPIEWRDEQITSWSTIGAIIVVIPHLAVMFLSTFCLLWYSFYDTQSSFFRSDPHPFFKFKDGSDIAKTLNPFFVWCFPLGPQGKTPRYLFYQEIEDAIKTKKKQQLAKKSPKALAA